VIGCLASLVALRVVRRRMQGGPGVLPGGLFVLFGALAGFGLWANALSLVLSAPAALYLLWAMWKFRRGWLAGFFLIVGGGFLLGSLPWWVFAAINGPTHLIQELLGSAVSVEGGPWLARVGQHVINFLLLGLPVTFGFRPPWNVDWLAAPLLPLVLIFWLAVLGFFARQLRKDNPRRAEYGLLAGIFGVLLAGFLFILVWRGSFRTIFPAAGHPAGAGQRADAEANCHTATRPAAARGRSGGGHPGATGGELPVVGKYPVRAPLSARPDHAVLRADHYRSPC
jgi:hypothetical protein